MKKENRYDKPITALLAAKTTLYGYGRHTAS